jgi:hypothetical protein
MTPLNHIDVAPPCHESWDQMEGDVKKRFCRICRKNVYNLSAMTTREAEEFVAGMEGKSCIRFYRRADGTLLTSDCPVAARRVWKRKTISFAWAISVAIACLAGSQDRLHAKAKQTSRTHTLRPKSVQKDTSIMGKIVVPAPGKQARAAALLGEVAPTSRRK